MSDRELIEKFLQGNIEAFNTLVWRWQKIIFNFVWRDLGNREEAHDVTQQVFIRAHRHLHNLKDRERFATWLYQIAANLCRDVIKQRRRRQVLSLESMQENGSSELATNAAFTLTPESEQHPDRIVSRSQLRDLLEKALQEIPEEQRVVVIMKEYQNLKFAEIAEILGAPVNTVKSRLYYGLNALKKVLARWEIDREVLSYEM